MSILHSYRWRRRLKWTGGFAVLVAAVVVGAVAWPTKHEQASTTGSRNAVVYHAPKTRKLNPADRREIERTLVAFVRTAVRRDRVSTAWPLAGPGLRAGVTRAEWNRGDIPVVPYRASLQGLGDWYVDYSYAGRVALEIVLQPEPGAKVGAQAVTVELVPRGRRWLVDSWLSQQTFPQSTPRAAPAQGANANRLRPPPAPPPIHAALSPLWWALPLALLGLVLGVPLAFFLVRWWQNARAERVYRRASRP